MAPTTAEWKCICSNSATATNRRPAHRRSHRDSSSPGFSIKLNDSSWPLSVVLIIAPVVTPTVALAAHRMRFIVIIEQNTMGGPLEVVELTGSDRPEEGHHDDRHQYHR